MGLCNICADAVAAIDPHQNSTGQYVRCVNANLPQRSGSGISPCWICETLADWLSAKEPQVVQIWKQSLIEVIFRFTGVGIDKNEKDSLPVITLDVEVKPSSYLDEGCCIELVFIPARDFPVNTNRPSNMKPQFSANMTLIRNWLRTCKKRHTCCGNNNASWYPTRLLQLRGHHDNIRLIISKEQHIKTPYATLSHRWGQGNYPKLKTATIDQMKNHIAVNKLPQIFQDAIQIARGLGIQYLWIDSLCIVQDSDNDSDWETESRLMHRIYGSALLNISATASASGDESLFQQGGWDALMPHETRLLVDGSLETYYCIDDDIWIDELVEAPLNRRAWVLQERFLAQRVLHFGPHQLAWECNGAEAMEMFPEGLPPRAVLSRLSKTDINKVARRSDDVGHHITLANLWIEILEDYTTRQLTYSKDRLRALEGMANHFSELRQDRYYAGLWESSLITHLVWQCLDVNEPEKVYDRTPNFARAPSWSWASLDVPIVFPKEYIPTRPGIFVARLQLTPDPKYSQLSSVFHHHVHMIGRSMTLHLRWNNGSISSFLVEGVEFEVVKHAPILSNLVIEHSEREVRTAQAKGNLFWVPLYISSMSLNGIVVIKIRGINNHMRVGTGVFPLKEMIPDDQIGALAQATDVTSATSNDDIDDGRSTIDVERRPLMENLEQPPDTRIWRLLALIRDRSSWRFISVC